MVCIDSVYLGKVRNNAVLSNGLRVCVTTDRISAFDVVFPFEIPGKGELLQALSVLFFKKTEHIIENHLLGVLDHNHLLVKNAKVFPVELVVRGHLTGSLWRLYAEQGPEGVWAQYGVSLPAGLQQNQKLPEPILTPTTKAHAGHDTPLSLVEAAARVGATVWQELVEKSMALFAFGQREAQAKGLVLVDTKYEMGLYEGRVILVDEVHTTDSSRYWYAHEAGCAQPRQISKEFLREELIAQFGNPESFTQTNIVQHPLFRNTEFVHALVTKVQGRYLELFQTLSGGLTPADVYTPADFVPWPVSQEQLHARILASTLPKKVLVVGNGGRDYTLCEQFAALVEVDTVYHAAGARLWAHPKFQPCPFSDVNRIAAFAKEHGVGLVVAGPELPIAQGLADACAALSIPALAPRSSSASLESSKILCKDVLNAAQVQTPGASICSWTQLQNQTLTTPCVLKYDGLASGKGVFVLKEQSDVPLALAAIGQNLEAWTALDKSLVTPSYSKQKGEPHFLIEEMIDGEEFSAIALCNQTHFRLLSIARDYKRLHNAQTGPNTGGMGCVAPVPLSPAILEQVRTAFRNTLQELQRRNEPYYGFLFAGFMLDKKGMVHVLEYNCRLGDPETQVILPAQQREFYAELWQTAQKHPFLEPQKSESFFAADDLKRVFVVGASPEYPDHNPLERRLCRPAAFANPDAQIAFVPSAIEPSGATKGGRAFGILACADSFQTARAGAYQAMDHIQLENNDGSLVKPHFRTDIGAELEEQT